MPGEKGSFCFKSLHLLVVIVAAAAWTLSILAMMSKQWLRRLVKHSSVAEHIGVFEMPHFENPEHVEQWKQGV